MQTRIAFLRKEKGLSLEDVAKAAGTTKAQIQKLERGDRRLSLEWMGRLAKAMNTKISELLPPEEVTLARESEETAILEILSRLPDRDRAALIGIVRRLLLRLEDLDG
jgi:transcriptional regulator with XRE-family HTH domain